jgi:hypothetical protein
MRQEDYGNTYSQRLREVSEGEKSEKRRVLEILRQLEEQIAAVVTSWPSRWTIQ